MTLVATNRTGHAVARWPRHATVYVLPEPWLSSATGRQGDYAHCTMVHNDVKPFMGVLDVVGDLPDPLFRGVRWSGRPAAIVIQGTVLETLMTIKSPRMWSCSFVMPFTAHCACPLGSATRTCPSFGPHP